MMNLAEYRHKAQRLADFLPWVALVGKGVVLNKDGSFQRTAKFRGPDLDSATPAELVAIRTAADRPTAINPLRIVQFLKAGGRIHAWKLNRA